MTVVFYATVLVAVAVGRAVLRARSRLRAAEERDIAWFQSLKDQP